MVEMLELLKARLQLVVLACLVVTAGPAHAQWGTEKPLTATGGDVFGEGIATAGSNVHVIFGNSDVRYRSSGDQGTTWSSERTLDTGVIHLTDPMVADGTDVWAIYLKNIRTLTDWCCARDVGDIYLLHSGDSGVTWDTPKQLTTAQGAFRVSIAYDANKVHIVWMDYRDAKWDTYYLRSSDRGATWDPERVIAASAGTFGAERPQVAARGNGVHVTIWDDRGTNPPCMAGSFSFDPCADTFYIGSLDGGTTWGAEVPVSYSGAAFAGRNDIAVAGTSSVVVNFNRAAAGTADANPHMFAVRSTDNGATWETPVQLTNTPGSSDHGSIIGAGPAVFLAWHDSRSGVLEIRYAQSTDEGMTWDADEKASTPTTTEASTPLLAVTTDYVHALWLDKRTGPYQVMYRRRDRPTVPVTGADAGTGDTDAGTNPDTGDSSGCGCESSRSPTGILAPLFAFVLVLGRRKRRPGL
jgi:MYXO-CTERM domain-containing protein